MTNEAGYTLKDYRAAIRLAWLPVVGRKQLRSHEYDMCQEWFDAQVPVGIVLRAIYQCARRAKAKGKTIYSLGVIRADIEALQRSSAQTHVGSQASAADWRADWDENLAGLAEGANNPELAAMCNELRRDLPTLNRAQADARWMEIKRAYL